MRPLRPSVCFARTAHVVLGQRACPGLATGQLSSGWPGACAAPQRKSWGHGLEGCRGLQAARCRAHPTSSLILMERGCNAHRYYFSLPDFSGLETQGRNTEVGFPLHTIDINDPSPATVRLQHSFQSGNNSCKTPSLLNLVISASLKIMFQH